MQWKRKNMFVIVALTLVCLFARSSSLLELEMSRMYMCATMIVDLVDIRWMSVRERLCTYISQSMRANEHTARTGNREADDESRERERERETEQIDALLV
jgi:hypothetical protein